MAKISEMLGMTSEEWNADQMVGVHIVAKLCIEPGYGRVEVVKEIEALDIPLTRKIMLAFNCGEVNEKGQQVIRRAVKMAKDERTASH